MYTVSIYLLGSGQALSFQFKDEMRGIGVMKALDDARLAGRAEGTPEDITIKDDYGRHAVLLMEEISGWLGGDLAKSFEGQVDASIIQTRAQIDAQQRAMQDPKLKLAASHMANSGLIVPGRSQ